MPTASKNIKNIWGKGVHVCVWRERKLHRHSSRSEHRQGTGWGGHREELVSYFQDAVDCGKQKPDRSTEGTDSNDEDSGVVTTLIPTLGDRSMFSQYERTKRTRNTTIKDEQQHL